MCRMNRDFIVFMRKKHPQVTEEQFEFGRIRTEDNEKEEDGLKIDLILQHDVSSQLPTCRSSPRIPHTSWHTWHTHICQKLTPGRRFVKSATLVRLKTHFLRQWNPSLNAHEKTHAWHFEARVQKAKLETKFGKKTDLVYLFCHVSRFQSKETCEL